MIPDKTPLPPIEDLEAFKKPAPKLELIDKYAKNKDGLNVAEKSYLAQFYMKPNQSVDREYEKLVPKPVDKTSAEYNDNPLLGGNGYNLNFEPYASKYDNKLLVDVEGNGDVIGVM